MTGELVRILCDYMEKYNHVISLSNSLEKIYEIFTEGAFQMLLDMDPNDSEGEFDVLKKSIRSVKSEFDLELQNLRDTTRNNKNMICNEKWKIKRYMWKYEGNDKYVGDLKGWELLRKINELVFRIINGFDSIKHLFGNILNSNDRGELRHSYEEVKIIFPHHRDSILLNLNHAKSLILQLHLDLIE